MSRILTAVSGAMLLAVSMGHQAQLKSEESGAGIIVTEGLWPGEVRNGEKCVILENPGLKVTILTKGAYIISVVDKRSGEEFIHSMKANSSSNHGIYDRVDENGGHSYDLNSPKHFANREYVVEQLAPGLLRFTSESDALRIERTVKLDSERPKMRVDVTYTCLSADARKMGIVLITQLNLNQAPISYNHVVAMPREEAVDRLTTNSGGAYGATATAGWWFVLDRDSKKSVVMIYPTDGLVENIYLYRTESWIHLLPLGPAKLLNKGDTLSLWQEYRFLSGPDDAGALSAADVAVVPAEFTRLKRTLLEELSAEAVKPGQTRSVELPKVSVDSQIEPPLGGKPEASLVVLRNAVYDHPTALDRRTWTSLDRLLLAAAEVKESSADLLVVCGASSNGLENEFDLAKRAASLSGLKVAYVPNAADAGKAELFEKTLGPRNWVSQVKDLTLISFAPGETQWLAQAIEKAAGRILVIGEEVPSDLVGKTKVTLALLKQSTSMPSFARVGNWPVLYVPQVQDTGHVGITVLSIFPDYLDVLVKPLGGSFGPRLYLDNDGRSQPMGIPPFIKDDPILKVAHISDTQLELASARKTADGKPLDQENMKNAIAEVNALGVDFAVNTGDLVNVGTNEEQWKLYVELKKPLHVPLYELLGNHDWDELRPDGRCIATNYQKFVDDPLIYDFEKNGIFFMVFATAASKGDDLRQRLPKAEKAKCVVLLYHDPITTSPGYNWWSLDLHTAAHELKPTIAMAGHTHHLQWNKNHELREFVSSALAWTKTGDQTWNGFFVHTFFEDKVVSSYKRLGCDDLFFTVITPYR